MLPGVGCRSGSCGSAVESSEGDQELSACRDHYRLLHQALGTVLEDSFVGVRSDAMAKSHAFTGDLALWLEVLKERPEVSVLQSAAREYQFGLLALASGQYRAAFSALRLAMELSFAAVQWSANERELREWQRGQRDSNWSGLIDNENGIFSKQFVRLFSEVLVDEISQYRASAAAVYRECSEYVHGNAHTHRSLPEQLMFNEAAFSAWHAKASVVRLSVSFALAARYLLDLKAESRAQLEHMLLDNLGHSTGVRVMLGAPTEVANG